MARRNAPKTAQLASGRHSTTLSQRHLPGSSSSASTYKHLMPCSTLAAIRNAEKRGVRYVPYLTLIANRPAKQRRRRLDTRDQQQGPAASPSPHLLPHTNNNSHRHDVTNNSPTHAPPALSPHTHQQNKPEALLHEQTLHPVAGATSQQHESDDDTSQVFVAEYVHDLITQALARALCGQEGGRGHQQASHSPPSVTVIMGGAAREAPPPPPPPQPRTIQPLAQRLLKAGAGWYRGVSTNTTITTNNNDSTKTGWISRSRSSNCRAAPRSSGVGSAPGSTSTAKPRSASSRHQSLTWGRQPTSPPCAAVSRQMGRFPPPSAPAVPSSPPTVIIALEAQSNQHPVHDPASHTTGHRHAATPTRDRAASQDSGEGWGSSEDGGLSDTSQAGGRDVLPVAESSPHQLQQGCHSLSQSRKALNFFTGSESSTPCAPSPLLDSPQPAVSPTIGAGAGPGGGAHRRRQPHPSPTSLTLTQPPCRTYSPSSPTPDTDRERDTGARKGDQHRRVGLLKPDLLGLAGKRVVAALRQRRGKGSAAPLPRARTLDVVDGQGCGGSESGSLAMAATTPGGGRRGWGAGQEALTRKVGLRAGESGGDHGEEGEARCGCVGRCSIM